MAISSLLYEVIYRGDSIIGRPKSPDQKLHLVLRLRCTCIRASHKKNPPKNLGGFQYFAMS